MYHITDWTKVSNSSEGDHIELTGVIAKQYTQGDKQVLAVQSPPEDSHQGKTPFEIFAVSDGEEQFRIGDTISFSGKVTRITDKSDTIVSLAEVNRTPPEPQLSDSELDSVEEIVDEYYSS